MFVFNTGNSKPVSGFVDYPSGPQNWEWVFTMQISEEKIIKYMELYFKKYNKHIDKAQALTELTSLVCLLEAVYKHINNKNYENRN